MAFARRAPIDNLHRRSTDRRVNRVHNHTTDQPQRNHGATGAHHSRGTARHQSCGTARADRDRGGRVVALLFRLDSVARTAEAMLLRNRWVRVDIGRQDYQHAVYVGQLVAAGTAPTHGTTGDWITLRPKRIPTDSGVDVFFPLSQVRSIELES